MPNDQRRRRPRAGGPCYFRLRPGAALGSSFLCVTYHHVSAARFEWSCLAEDGGYNNKGRLGDACRPSVVCYWRVSKMKRLLFCMVLLVGVVATAGC